MRLHRLKPSLKYLFGDTYSYSDIPSLAIILPGNPERHLSAYSGSAVMLLSENGRKIERKILRLIFRPVIGIVAYPLSRSQREFHGRNVTMWIVVFCMLFNGGTIPWYMCMKNYGMMDNMAGLILSGSLPVYNVILMMNFFRNFPKDVEEAAIMDGAGKWRTLFQIVVPCSKSVIATITLFVSVYYWNEYFQGLVLSNSESHYPLQTYIRQIVVSIPMGVNLTTEQMIKMNQLSNKSLNAAKVFITIIPMLAVYPFIQKYFVTGIMIGSVKE